MSRMVGTALSKSFKRSESNLALTEVRKLSAAAERKHERSSGPLLKETTLTTHNLREYKVQKTFSFLPYDHLQQVLSQTRNILPSPH